MNKDRESILNSLNDLSLLDFDMSLFTCGAPSMAVLPTSNSSAR